MEAEQQEHRRWSDTARMLEELCGIMKKMPNDKLAKRMLRSFRGWLFNALGEEHRSWQELHKRMREELEREGVPTDPDQIV